MILFNKFAHEIVIVASGFMLQKQGKMPGWLEFNIILLKLKIRKKIIFRVAFSVTPKASWHLKM